ncbi:MAG: dTDP-4-dehydrorhamnose reductase [Planctomycetota bacterium]
MAFDFLLTGGRGQLGRSLEKAIEERGLSCCTTDVPELRVDDSSSVREWIGRARPGAVLHCGAVTDVDGCERDPGLAERVNAKGTANVARACADASIPLVYISTDFVFDGRGRRPYREDDEPNPLSVYGRTKLEGELAVLSEGRDDFYVVRTSWVFGPKGRNFPAAILKKARGGEPLRVVTDQIGRPTMTDDLASAILDLLEIRPAAGIYHCSDRGVCSWHRFACDVLDLAGLSDVEVGEMLSQELGRPAARPAYSVMDLSKIEAALGRRMPDYRDAIERYLRQEME